MLIQKEYTINNKYELQLYYLGNIRHLIGTLLLYQKKFPTDKKKKNQTKAIFQIRNKLNNNSIKLGCNF